MRKIYCLLTIISLTTMSLISKAQSNTNINGTIRNGEKTLEAASVSLLRARDSSLVKAEITDKAGRFEFQNVGAGDYLVAASSVGFQKKYSKSFKVTGEQPILALEEMSLAHNSTEMKEVVVTTKRPLIEQKADKMIVNVDASVTNVGSSALEVLEKSPGVLVDKDGNISLKGKSGVIVLVDGRQTYLSGPDLANMLRNMNSSQLDQIEIMTNPSAKYDASGNSGIINIKTKKNKQRGFNGSTTLGYGQGKLPKFNESLNLNYRTGKFNLFTNLSHNYWEGFQNLDIFRRFREKDSKQVLSVFDQHAKMERIGRSYNAKFGADYFISKKTTIGVVVSGFQNPGYWNSRNITDIMNSDEQLLSQTRASSDVHETWKNFSSNINFRQVFDSTGRELTADFDYIRYKSHNDQSLVNSYFDAAGQSLNPTDTLLGRLPSDIRIYSAKMDYTHPLKKGAKFEAGLKTSFVKTDNDAKYDSVKSGILVPDLGRTNHFVYEENVNAAYVNLSKPLTKKLTGQVGLRLENTIAKGHQITTGVGFNRNYTQLFPTAYLSYALNDKNQFSVNYGRRIDRPDYGDLNPFIYFIDRYTYQVGNPDLKPQFSHNVELSHTYNSFLTTTLNYSNTKDIIQEVLEQNEATNETFIRKANIANQRNLGIAVSINTPLQKWWTLSFYSNLYNNHFKGIVNDTNISIGNTTLLLNVNNQFKLGKGWSAELSGFYRSKGLESVIVIKPLGQVSAGFAKQILKTKGTVKLNVRDIFLTQVFEGYSRYSNIDARFKNSRDSRVVNLSFTYRFGKMNNNGGQRKRGGASEEESRVKSGGGN
jgi:iron complex outermembrane receptor protein